MAGHINVSTSMRHFWDEHVYRQAASVWASGSGGAFPDIFSWRPIFAQHEAFRAAQAFPTHRARRIAKSDEDVNFMSGEVPLLLCKAAEAFVYELTTRAWNATSNSRRCIVSVRAVSP